MKQNGTHLDNHPARWHDWRVNAHKFYDLILTGGVFQYLDETYGDWNWLKKSADKQSVKRFHIHIYREEKLPDESSSAAKADCLTV